MPTRLLFVTAVVFMVAGGGLLFFSGPPSVAVAQLRSQEERPNPLTNNAVRRAFSDQFGRNPNRASNTMLLVSAGCFAVGITIALICVERYYRSRSTKDGYYNKGQLFRELCKAHEFNPYQQTVLRSIAKELQIKNPAVLFVEPKHLELALIEPVVRYPQESIRQIFNELFSSGDASVGLPEEEHNSWFAWTNITNNPEAAQLKKEPKKEEARPQESETPTDLPQTQQWDPSMWEEVQRAALGMAREKKVANPFGSEVFSSELSQSPIYQSPPLRKDVEEREKTAYHYTDQKTVSLVPHKEPERAASEKAGDRPRYPETRNAAHSAVGEGAVTPSVNRPGPGAQILSSMLHSVSDVTDELTFSSIRNHLTRSISLSPQSFGEIKRPVESEAGSAIPLEDIMVSPREQRERPEPQTQVETKSQPKVVVKPIELKSLDWKPPLPE